LALSECSAVW